MHKAGKHVMSPLNNGHFIIKVYEAEPVSRILYLKLKNTETLGCAELCVVHSVVLVLKGESCIGVKHCEVHLYVVGCEGSPHTMGFLAQLQIVFYFVLNEVVFRRRVLARVSDVRAFFLVVDVVDAENA